jgi:hypothetical protein
MEFCFYTQREREREREEERGFCGGVVTNWPGFLGDHRALLALSYMLLDFFFFLFLFLFPILFLFLKVGLFLTVTFG